MTLQKLPKPGSYKAYLASMSGDFLASAAPILTKAAWMKQKKQAQKAANAAAKADQKAAIAAAQAAGAQAGQSLASGILAGESGGVPGSVPFGGGSAVGSTLAKLAVFALPLGALALIGWYILKRRKKK